METSISTSPLDVNVFRTFSPGWLEKLEAEDLEALELELAEQLERANKRIDDFCAGDALKWLQTYTMTENPKHKEQGLPYKAPFPRKSYFAPIFEAFRNQSRLFIPKSREMLTSWCVSWRWKRRDAASSGVPSRPTRN